jgi:hypothetical protein
MNEGQVAKDPICGFVHSIRIGTRSWREPDLVRRCQRMAKVKPQHEVADRQ